MEWGNRVNSPLNGNNGLRRRCSWRLLPVPSFGAFSVPKGRDRQSNAGVVGFDLPEKMLSMWRPRDFFLFWVWRPPDLKVVF